MSRSYSRHYTTCTMRCTHMRCIHVTYRMTSFCVFFLRQEKFPKHLLSLWMAAAKQRNDMLDRWCRRRQSMHRKRRSLENWEISVDWEWTIDENSVFVTSIWIRCKICLYSGHWNGEELPLNRCIPCFNHGILNASGQQRDHTVRDAHFAYVCCFAFEMNDWLPLTELAHTSITDAKPMPCFITFEWWCNLIIYFLSLSLSPWPIILGKAVLVFSEAVCEAIEFIFLLPILTTEGPMRSDNKSEIL